MDGFKRYAVCAAPEPGPLAKFAAGWLGWDAETGTARPHPQLAGLPRPVAELTSAPRRYGFHGTLKPPFRLANGSRLDALRSDLAGLAETLAAIALEGLTLARLGGCLALTPEGDTRALDWLAAEVLIKLDVHRAPAPEAELAHRRAAGLTPRQATHLAVWGDPFVLDEFRFHFPLTGRLAAEEAEAVEAVLAPELTPRVPRPFNVDALVLLGEDTGGRFHVLHRYALTG